MTISICSVCFPLEFDWRASHCASHNDLNSRTDWTVAFIIFVESELKLFS